MNANTLYPKSVSGCGFDGERNDVDIDPVGHLMGVIYWNLFQKWRFQRYSLHFMRNALSVAYPEWKEGNTALFRPVSDCIKKTTS